jgi:hypothetical protein
MLQLMNRWTRRIKTGQLMGRPMLDLAEPRSPIQRRPAIVGPSHPEGVAECLSSTAACVRLKGER